MLTGFATDSYDRSFETILITILINEEHKKKMRETGGGLMILAVKDVAEDNEKKNVYTKILEWFEKEKEEEMKSEESIKN